jgi:hypothetical protein
MNQFRIPEVPPQSVVPSGTTITQRLTIRRTEL